MSVTLAIMAAGALVGGLSGASSGASRASEARRQFELSKDYLDSVKKRNTAQRNILVGNLSMAALSTSSQNRNTAMEVEAANDAQRNSVGSSGLSGGTPFYKLDQDIRDRQTAVVEQNIANRMKMGSAYDEAVAGMAGMDFEEKKARYQLMDAGEESAYTNSIMGTVMPIASGAMQGAATAQSLMSMGVESRLLTEDFLSSGFGDLFQAKDNAAGYADVFRNAEVYASGINYNPSGNFYGGMDPVGLGASVDSAASMKGFTSNPFKVDPFMGSASMLSYEGLYSGGVPTPIPSAWWTGSGRRPGL